MPKTKRSNVTNRAGHCACGKSLSGKRRDAKWCSVACKSKASRDRKKHDKENPVEVYDRIVAGIDKLADMAQSSGEIVDMIRFDLRRYVKLVIEDLNSDPVVRQRELQHIAGVEGAG